MSVGRMTKAWIQWKKIVEFIEEVRVARRGEGFTKELDEAITDVHYWLMPRAVAKEIVFGAFEGKDIEWEEMIALRKLKHTLE